jgi:hypothetical protein
MISDKNIYLLLVIFLILIIIIFTYKKSKYISEKFNEKLPYNVVIVGCARNIDKYLDNTKNKLLMLKSLFVQSKIIIYENDSTDETLNILKKWEDERLIELITEKNIKGVRTERLAHGRNVLYNEAMKNDFDLYIVIDLDDVIMDLSEEAVKSCFEMKEDWGMVGANQTGKYYDLWALRTFDDWMPFDCYADCFNKNSDHEYCINSRYRIIPQNTEPIDVKSCFGGFGIYKKKYINNCSYGTGLNHENKEICEHVTFNEGVINNGGKIYINPKLINF